MVTLCFKLTQTNGACTIPHPISANVPLLNPEVEIKGGFVLDIDLLLIKQLKCTCL